MQKRYLYVLIDEYQDTNQTQLELIKLIVDGHKNLMVVGDDDQSIYSWRGATPYNILDFEKTYPDAQRILLEDNYRSSGNIVEAASAVISNNTFRAEKKLRTNKEPGDQIDFLVESDGEMEAWSIINNIKSERSKFPYETVAIFYRTNAQSRLLEDALRVENIPYQIFGSVKFYDRLEVKDILAYLRLLANPSDDISFLRVVNTPGRGIGAKAVEQIQDFASKQECGLLSASRRIVADNVPKLAKKIASFVMLYDHLEAQYTKVELDDLVDLIVDCTNYFEYLKKKFADQYVDKMENVHELTNAISDYMQANPKATLQDWLQSITLVRDGESDGEEETGVSLMTLHMAKGLEYDRVFITGCEENILPHSNSLDDNMACEEERRLFYVGMTRAKVKLSLYAAYYRRIYNKAQKNSPSRFIGEIPRQFLANTTSLMNHSDATSDPYSDVTYDYSESQSASSKLAMEQEVYHLTYGKGHIVELPGWPEQGKVVVNFEEFGRRKVSTSQLDPT
jgi:DNA helicase-2/ATP-dependent DNA helicase PcrA